MTRTGRLRLALIFLLLAATAACDFGSNSSVPTAPDQSNVAFSTTDLTVGTGTEATNGTTASAVWRVVTMALLITSTQIDPEPDFVSGEPIDHKGFYQGVVGMKVGGTRRIVPPSLAYGSQGSQSVPPNAALVFDIGLMNVVAPGASGG